MSGYTVQYTPVTTVNLINVICNTCSGECTYTVIVENDVNIPKYKCNSCGMVHDNPNDNLHPPVQYLTEQEDKK